MLCLCAPLRIIINYLLNIIIIISLSSLPSFSPNSLQYRVITLSCHHYARKHHLSYHHAEYHCRHQALKYQRHAAPLLSNIKHHLPMAGSKSHCSRLLAHHRQTRRPSSRAYRDYRLPSLCVMSLQQVASPERFVSLSSSLSHHQVLPRLRHITPCRY